MIKVKKTIERHIHELFKCDNNIITVDPVKEYKCSKENVITFKANLRAYHAVEKVEKFYMYLKLEGMTLFNNSVVVEPYFDEPPHPMYHYAYIAMAMAGLVLLAVVFVAVKRCRRTSPK